MRTSSWPCSPALTQNWAGRPAIPSLWQPQDRPLNALLRFRNLRPCSMLDAVAMPIISNALPVCSPIPISCGARSRTTPPRFRSGYRGRARNEVEQDGMTAPRATAAIVGTREPRYD